MGDGGGNEVVGVDWVSFLCHIIIEEVGIDLSLKQIPTMMFPDWRHLIKKWRNQLLNVRRVLILGNEVVMLEHLIKTLEKDRIISGLWKSDVFVKDKQNVKAAQRILNDEVRICMKELDDKQTVSTRVYLKIGQLHAESIHRG